jgi:pimeloyl-ACP methyl ester carboxylesterase
MHAPFDVQAFETGQATISVAEGPRSGPPLLLIHGGSSRWQAYRGLLDALALDWHVYAPDLRGHGASSWTPGRYRLWDYAADVIFLLERVVGEPAAIAGHSLGGEVAIIAASDRPDLVRAVIGIDAPVSIEGARRMVIPDRERLAWLQSLHGRSGDGVAAALRELPTLDAATGRRVRAADVWGDEPGLFEEQAETILHNDPAMLDAVIEFEGMHAGYDAERVLPRVECPVLLLLADTRLGSAVPEEDAEAAVRVLRDARVVRLPGTTHGLVWEEPEAVEGAIGDFLRRSVG